MARILAPFLACLASLLALASLGCAAGSSGSQARDSQPQGQNIAPEDALALIDPAGVQTPDGLVQVRSEGLPGALYVRPPRPHLQRYTHIYVVSSTVSYARGGDSLTESEEAALRRYFDRRITEELEASSGWALAEAPGHDVLAVAVGALELDVHPESPGSAVSYVASSRPAVLVVELRDSESGTVLLRYMERRGLPTGSFGGGQTDSRRVRRVFSDFAESAAEHLESYHATVRQIERMEGAAAGSQEG